jgi:hypothetical protein
VSIHGLSEAEILEQAERGDLRPQFNPRSVVTWPLESGNGHFDPKVIVPALANRFFELARPIADAHREPGLNMRISDAGRFFYLIEALERLGYQGVEGMLLVFLDEFSQLEQRSYDELYLWSIVELSRRNPDHIDTFWPMALTLDMRFRASPWERPADYSLVDLPYRMFELVMYYYAFQTIYRAANGRRRYPSLLSCLRRIRGKLSESEDDLLMETLRDLARHERRPAFGDAHGLLLKVRK